MGYKIYKQFPVQVFTKYSQIGIFGTQVGITSGSIEWLLTDHSEWGGITRQLAWLKFPLVLNVQWSFLHLCSAFPWDVGIVTFFKRNSPTRERRNRWEKQEVKITKCQKVIFSKKFSLCVLTHPCQHSD
jgi:hypothetical protein